VTAPVAIALLGALASIAIAVACLAMLRARAARTALRASEAKHRESAELGRKIEAGSRLAGDVAHDLNDLLTAITGHTELLIVSLDPSGPSIQDAHEIRRAALSAARLTKALRTQVNAIVKQAGGRIQVDSAAGAGATFTIDLPAASESAVGPEAALAATRLTAPVLVVEDEPRVRELIRLVLVRAGHEVMAVAGPHAALAALHRQPAISLMLVDVVMPEMDGYDLVAEARKISPGIHVVFISGFAPDATRHPSGDGFLAKPFTVESLTDIVEHALDAP
jgi:CheY-like chemotaxis protein